MSSQTQPRGGNGNGNGRSAAMVLGPKERQENLRTLFDKNKGAIATLLPKHLSAERLLRTVTFATQRTPDLLACTPESILQAAMLAGMLGLEPNTPLGLAYLVPYKNRKKDNRLEAQFICGYKGLVQLAIQSGEIRAISSRLVCENDEFDISYGTDERIVHRPIVRGPSGPFVGVYAIARLKSSDQQFEFMTMGEVDVIRAQSKASSSGPWVDHYGEMARKTSIRRLCKTLPLSGDKLAKALAAHAQTEAGEAIDYGRIIDVPFEGVSDDAPSHEPAAANATDQLRGRLENRARVSDNGNAQHTPREQHVGAPASDYDGPPADYSDADNDGRELGQ